MPSELPDISRPAVSGLGDLPFLEDVLAIAFGGVLVILLFIIPAMLVVRDFRSDRTDPGYDGPVEPDRRGRDHPEPPA